MRPKVFFALFVLVAVAAAAYGLLVRGVVQPAAFNHKKHVTELNMPCVACHNGALGAVHATLPPTQICMNCHQDSTKPIFAPIKAYFAQEGEVPWVRVTGLPSHAYFSHRRHTQLGQLRCQECHGPMEKQEVALVRPLLPMGMQRCIECHRRLKAATDCDACHR